jgi:hypothetical protein
MTDRGIRFSPAMVRELLAGSPWVVVVSFTVEQRNIDQAHP